MQPKTKAITAAVTGSALGIAGLAVMALPAGAGEAPQLPPVSAEDLVQSVLTAPTPALEGTVKVDNKLGLPTLPGAGSNALNLDSAQVYNDGNGRSRLAVKQGSTEETVVHDGATVWTYNSGDNSATKITLPQDVKDKGIEEGTVTDPTTAATTLLGKIRESSTVSVEGTARVADRPAYELVLTPKPTERTLLREVRVTVDAEKRLPLRFAVLTNGTADPALQIAFDDIDFAAQPADRFQFTPPQGAKVTEKQPQVDRKAAEEAQQNVKVVGDGWDTVLTGQIPAEALQPKQGKGGDVDPKALIAQLGKPVSGAFGSGHVITTKVGTALLTDDGRFAAGAVPEQVLIEALGSK
ncbi:LolA family protein [Amycolatopsis anabasis]|uniref:LolA family protein n=1 Tax=Amycolatopsis anabasis TaxID=1840409 RepID=UPI00131EA9D0|nr:sigma-E factor regulatory protein RseB domain-containing protein [Amycolatopsis anabasis]